MKYFLIIILFFLNNKVINNRIVPITEYHIFEAERLLFYNDIKNADFSEELLKKCMYYERIKYPDVVLTQAQLETGFYTSDIFRNGNNCFGMKYPQYRETIAIGIYQGHAKYNYWWESVIDYAMWQDWYLKLGYKINTDEDDDFYLVFLRCVRYAEDPKYIHKLVNIKELS